MNGSQPIGAALQDDQVAIEAAAAQPQPRWPVLVIGAGVLLTLAWAIALGWGVIAVVLWFF